MVLLCFFVIAVIIVTIVEMVRNKQAEDERAQQAAQNPEPIKEDPLVVAQRLMQRTEAYIQASIVHDDATKAALYA